MLKYGTVHRWVHIVYWQYSIYEQIWLTNASTSSGKPTYYSRWGWWPWLIAGHNWRWIDGSIPILSIDTIVRYYWSWAYWPPIVSIHRITICSFWSIVSIIDHKILVKPITFDLSVHFQPMVSIYQSKIDSPITILKENPVNILQQ